MKIGFVRLNDGSLYQTRSKSVLEPLGLEYLIGGIWDKVDCILWDLNVGDVFDGYFYCSYICVTIPTPLYNQAKELIKTIHETCGAKVIVGGPHPSIFPSECISDLGADYVVVGEGESALFDILLGGTDRIVYGTSIDIDAIKFPHRFFRGYSLDLGKTVSPVVSVLTSRSCPYECVFCSSKKIFGNRLRLRSVTNIMLELQEIILAGYNTVIFLDDTFTFNRVRTFQLCQKIISEGMKFSWWIDTRVDKVDRELLETMREAGCTFIVYGIESGNQEILNRINKNITIAQIKNAVHLTKSANIGCKANFMLGHKDETKGQMFDTINLAKELQATKTSFYQVVPLPGTPLFTGVSSTLDYDNYKWYGDNVPSICSVSSKELKEIQQRAYEELDFDRT